MRTLLLAAGLGTRLRPITDHLPKCLVPIQGQVLLQIWLERLIQAGLGPFLINTHYLAELVQSFVSSSPFANKITLSHESALLGTAGTVLTNRDFFAGQDGLVIHADNYCKADLKAFVDAHHTRPSGCLMTMMTFQTETPESCGIVELDHRGVVMQMHEKVVNPPGNLANGAIYIFSNELLADLAINHPHLTDISTEVIPLCLGRIYTYQTKELFADIGTPEIYERINRKLAQ